MPALSTKRYAMSLIRSHEVGVQYGGNRILCDIDFSINRGEIVTIVGPNGSGKSTFLRVLIGAQHQVRGVWSKPRRLE